MSTMPTFEPSAQSRREALVSTLLDVTGQQIKDRFNAVGQDFDSLIDPANHQWTAQYISNIFGVSEHPDPQLAFQAIAVMSDEMLHQFVRVIATDPFPNVTYTDSTGD